MRARPRLDRQYPEVLHFGVVADQRERSSLQIGSCAFVFNASNTMTMAVVEQTAQLAVALRVLSHSLRIAADIIAQPPSKGMYRYRSATPTGNGTICNTGSRNAKIQRLQNCILLFARENRTRISTNPVHPSA